MKRMALLGTGLMGKPVGLRPTACRTWDRATRLSPR